MPLYYPGRKTNWCPDLADDFQTVLVALFASIVIGIIVLFLLSAFLPLIIGAALVDLIIRTCIRTSTAYRGAHRGFNAFARGRINIEQLASSERIAYIGSACIFAILATWSLFLMWS